MSGSIPPAAPISSGRKAWSAAPAPISSSGQDFAPTPGNGRAVPFYPPPGGTLLRLFVLPPPDPGLSEAGRAEIAEAFFAGNGIEHCRVDVTRHPLMHRTPTRDCVVLLQGRAQLLLDTGPPVELEPLDCVVQGATNHAWVNLGPGPAVFVALMAHPSETDATA